MGNAIAIGQDANVLPPRHAKILSITLDATSREKDLGSLELGDASVDRGGTVYLTLRADVKFWIKFHSATGATAIDETIADAAAAAITFATGYAIEIAANEFVHFRIDRKAHRYMTVKGSAGKLRGWASSDRSEAG